MELTSRQKDLLLENIIKLAQGLGADGLSKTAGVAEVGNIDLNKQKEAAFDFVFQGPNGLKRVAFAMQKPLKEKLDYYGIGRRLLMVDPIPQGELPVYDKDIAEFASVRVAAFGTPPMVEAKVKRLVFPTFTLARNQRVPYEEIQVRRYPVFDRAKERVAISMAIAEDREIFGILDTAATVGPNAAVTMAGGILTKSALADGYRTILSNQLQPAQVVMHPKQYGNILKTKQDEFDQVTLNVATETGMIGKMLGMQFLVSPKLTNQDNVFVTTTPDKLGRIPLRKELEVKVFDNVPKASYNVLAMEIIGFGIHNAYGVVRLQP